MQQLNEFLMDEDDDNVNEMENDEDNNFIDSPSLQRTGHIAVKYKKYMLVWGGYKADSMRLPKYMSTTRLWMYDFLLEKWSYLKTTEENAPVGVSGACALIRNDILYIFGGFCDEEKINCGNTNEIYSLNLNELVWRNYKFDGPKPVPCDKMVGWVHNEMLFYFGGFGMPPRNSNFEETRPCAFCYDESDVWNTRRGWNNQLVVFDTITEKWRWPSCKGTPPIPRAAHAAAKVASKVYIFGGRNTGVRMNDLHCLDLETMTWSGRLNMKGDVPQGRSWHTLTPISETLIVLYGGFTNQQEALSKCCDCWILELTTLSWTRITLPHDQPRMWHTACLGDPGEIIIFGGCMGNVINPRLIKQADVISLWFSPKSLLRLCLNAIIERRELFEASWTMLPSALQDILRIKSLRETDLVTSVD